ncbi:MAG: 4Fe-4S dicluster domain-containing protein [Vampirovibrionales bacterium]|nr:4Fe-4S dicluster domain-containing protein [Vampirovibrionales bacterium]
MTDFLPPEQSSNSLSQAPISRSGFLKLMWQKAKREVLGKIEAQVQEKWQRYAKPLQGARQFLRPPGAVENDHLFMALCTRCDACTAACPYEAIAVHYGAGYPYDGTPVMADLSQSPCLLCEDLPCIRSCPTDALRPLVSLLEIKIGEARIDNTTCLAYQGKPCAICVDVCPYPEVAISLLEGLPQVHQACVGCGICQRDCPTEPVSIRVFPVA